MFQHHIVWEIWLMSVLCVVLVTVFCKRKKKQSGVCYVTGLESQQNVLSTWKQIQREGDLLYWSVLLELNEDRCKCIGADTKACQHRLQKTQENPDAPHALCFTFDTDSNKIMEHVLRGKVHDFLNYIITLSSQCFTSNSFITVFQNGRRVGDQNRFQGTEYNMQRIEYLLKIKQNLGSAYLFLKALTLH